MQLQIMSPAASRVDFKVPPAARLDTLEGKNHWPLQQHDRRGPMWPSTVSPEHLSRRFSNVRFESYGGQPARRPPGIEPRRAYRRRGSRPHRRRSGCHGGAPPPIEGAARRGLPTTWLPWKRPACPSVGIAARSFRPGLAVPASTAGASPPPRSSPSPTPAPASSPTTSTRWWTSRSTTSSSA